MPAAARVCSVETQCTPLIERATSVSATAKCPSEPAIEIGPTSL